MKNKIIQFVLVFGTLFLLSCDRAENTDESDGLPYYEFTQAERTNLIIAPKVGDQINYKNQDGEIISFKVKVAENGKKTYGTGNFSSSSGMKHFYYDQQEISMWYVDGNNLSKCDIKIYKYPLDANYNVNPPVVGTPTFGGSIDFPLWIGTSSITIDFNSPLSTMTVGGKTYSKVRTFNSSNTTVLPNSPLPIRPRNVNVLYYDYNYGIIGFDDLNGKLWRLQ